MAVISAFIGAKGLGFNLLLALNQLNRMDFWRHKNDPLAEDWIFVDMIQLFQQFGVDLLKSITPR